MNKEESLISDAIRLNEEIQLKGLIHQALSRAIGSIVREESNCSIARTPWKNDDISYVPYLVDLSIKYAREADELADKLTTLMFEIKKADKIQ